MAGSSSSRFAFVGNSASIARFLFRPSFIRREFRMLSRALSVASDVFVEVPPNVSRGRVRSSENAIIPFDKKRIARAAQEGIVHIESESSFDVVVVGGGIAGCCAAIEAARAGASVCLASASGVFSGSSFYPGTWGLGLSDLATRPISTIWLRRFCTSPRRCHRGARRLVRAGYPRLSPRLKRWAFL